MYFNVVVVHNRLQISTYPPDFINNINNYATEYSVQLVVRSASHSSRHLL